MALANGRGGGGQRWTPAAWLEAVIATTAMTEAAHSAWCREHGLYPTALDGIRSALLAGGQMDGRMLGGVALAGLSGLFGSAGIVTLVVAYRVSDVTVWRRLAVLGGVDMLLSAVLAGIASRLMG